MKTMFALILMITAACASAQSDNVYGNRESARHA